MRTEHSAPKNPLTALDTRSRWPFSWSSLVLATALAASACASGNDLTSDPTPDAGGGASPGDKPDAGGDPGEPMVPPGSDPSVPEPIAPDFIYPERAFTGFDGVNTFRVPIVTSLTGATWEVADPTVARVEPLALPMGYEPFVAGMVVALKAGVTEVRAKAGAKTLSIQVTVQSYTPQVVAAGKMRYESPANVTQNRQACSFCHQSTNGVDHSPTALAYFADDEILAAITTGAYPDGYVLQGLPHKWDLTTEERAGIVPYLRSLPPGSLTE